jgi:hypothetical protein
LDGHLATRRMKPKFSAERELLGQIKATIKYKFYALAFGILCFFLVSSATRSAAPAIKAVNEQAVAARVAWAKQIHQPTLDSPILDDPAVAEIADEMERRVYSLILGIVGAAPGSEKVRELIEPRFHQLEQFESDRQAAFNIQFGSEYLKTPVIVNTLFLVDWWPLILLLILTFVCGLSMRQRMLEIDLTHIVQQPATKEERSLRSAVAGFYCGKLTPRTEHGSEVLVFTPSWGMIPERLLTASLAIALILLWFSLPDPGLPSRFDIATSFLGLNTIIVVAIGMAAYLLWKMHVYCREQNRDFAGKEVVGRFSLARSDPRERERGRRTEFSFRHVVALVLICASLVSFFLPWFGPSDKPIRGYSFFQSNKMISSSNGVPFYGISPVLFSEARIQLCIAGAFILVTAFGLLPRKGHSNLPRQISSYLGILIIALVANTLVYAFLFLHNANREVLGLILPIFDLSILAKGYGVPLLLRGTLYGARLFLASVACAAILSAPQREGTG